MIEKCTCGGTFRRIDGLDGMWCDKCDAYIDNVPDEEIDIKDIYNEDRLKSLRGVPHTTIIIGSESKGRLQVMIPADCTEQERRYIINAGIESLKYTLNRIKEEGLNIMPTRKGDTQ